VALISGAFKLHTLGFKCPVKIPDKCLYLFEVFPTFAQVELREVLLTDHPAKKPKNLHNSDRHLPVSY